MYRTLKLAHVLGFAMVLGSVLAHVVTGRAKAGSADPSFVLYARDTICLATPALTMPSLILTIGSGFGMMWLTNGELLRQRCLKVHVALSAAIVTTTMVIVTAVANLTWAARAFFEGRGSLQAFVGPEAIERYAGALNIVLVLFAASIAVTRPRLLARRSGRIHPAE